MKNDDKVISVKDLHVNFYNDNRCNRVLKGVSFDLRKGTILCIVGESGSGKSVTANSIMRLLPDLSRIESGSIEYFNNGEAIRIDKLAKNGKKIRAIRGKNISMIFQDPMTSLNPVFTVGQQISEMLLQHDMVKSRKEAKKKSIELLEEMGIPNPERRVNEYPHQFSGGMCQRAMIAMAMSCKPTVLIADEPTTALDVTIQAKIFELIKFLKNDIGMSIILITHDMGVVAELADDVAVMYKGKIVEQGDVRDIFKNPQHPYTKALLDSILVLGRGKNQELKSVQDFDIEF